jgi:hypothetical protein
MSSENLLARHSGAGRNPDEKRFPAKAGQHRCIVRFAEYLFLLDSGLRRNDEYCADELLGFK